MEAALPGRLATLRRLTAGDPVQSARAAELERLIAAYDAYAEREVAAGADRPRAALVTAVSGAAERLDGLRARQIDTRLLFEVRDRRAQVVVVESATGRD